MNRQASALEPGAHVRVMATGIGRALGQWPDHFDPDERFIVEGPMGGDDSRIKVRDERGNTWAFERKDLRAA